MKKAFAAVMVMVVCLLVWCGDQKAVEGTLIQAGEGTFLLMTEKGYKVGFTLEDEALVWTMIDEPEAREILQLDTTITLRVQYTPYSEQWIHLNRETVYGYQADSVQVLSYCTGRKAVLSDGTKLSVWKNSEGEQYFLPDGQQLLLVEYPVLPDGVAGLFFDLNPVVQQRILDYCDKQGLLYDLAEELEKAYSIYTGWQREQTYSFHPRTVSQRSEISAVSSRVVYCVTEVQLPGDASHSDSFSRCAAFDRETGEPISLLELFSCPVEEAVGRLLDIIQEQDTAFADIRDTAERELSPDNLPECLAVYEDGITVMFPVGKDGEYGIKLYFDSCLSLIALLEDWAVPVPYSQNA